MTEPRAPVDPDLLMELVGDILPGVLLLCRSRKKAEGMLPTLEEVQVCARNIIRAMQDEGDRRIQGSRRQL